jgi:hypothetical protein
LAKERAVWPNPGRLDNVNELDRAAMISAKLAAGELPRTKPEKVWAGKGTDQLYVACGTRIAADEVECEVDLPGAATLRFHRPCLLIWDQERQPPTQNTSDPEAGRAA